MTEQPQPPLPPSRFHKLLVGILRHPRATLERLVELPRRPWRRMALVIVVAVILPVVATYSITSQQASARFEDALSSQMPGAPTPAPVPMAPRGGVVRVGPGGVGVPPAEAMPAPRPSPVSGLALPALGKLGGLVLNWVLWSGVLYVTGTMMGGRNTFGQMLHMVVWTWAPHAVRGVLQAGYIWIAKEPIAHQGLSGLVVAESPVAGIPMPPNTGTLILQSLLGRVDIYLFWHLALIVLGLMAVARLSRRKAVTLALGAWVLLTLLSLLPNVILGSFAGLRMG